MTYIPRNRIFFSNIAKVTNEMRVGLAYESSTWYNLSDELSQKLVSVSSSSTGDDINDVSRLTLIFTHRTSYKHQVNYRKFCLCFGARGLISIDYAIKDYSKTKFKPESDSYYKSLNNFMSTT
jgi:hypothetical protein